jgi:hypothetical protein
MARSDPRCEAYCTPQLLHTPIGDVSGTACDGGGMAAAFVRGAAARGCVGGALMCRGTMRGPVCFVLEYGSAGHRGARHPDVRHRQGWSRRGGGGQRSFCKRLRLQGGCGKEQGQGRDGEDTRSAHDGTCGDEICGGSSCCHAGREICTEIPGLPDATMICVWPSWFSLEGRALHRTLWSGRRGWFSGCRW